MIKSISIVWHIDDVKARSSALGHGCITDILASKILQDIKRTHDASIGVTWDTIDAYVEMELAPGPLPE